MACWVFCVSCDSTVTNGDFNNDASWWEAAGNGQWHPLGTGPNRYAPLLNPGDQVYWATSVDQDGSNNSMVTDIRAAVGRKRGGATISSPFQINGYSLQNAGGAPSTISVSAGTNPPGTWTGSGPFIIVTDSGNKGNRSRYAFVLTATLSNPSLTNQTQFGEDPEMDVQNAN